MPPKNNNFAVFPNTQDITDKVKNSVSNTNKFVYVPLKKILTDLTS
jgi:hypothetical protein